MRSKSISMDKVLSIILAGGQGERLYPLTRDRAKPAVPIAGTLRIIDFVLNNMIKSDLRKIYVLTQAKQDSLNRHIMDFWNLYNFLGDHITTVPAQMRTNKEWYQGTADAVNQNMHLIDNNDDAELITIFGGDHVYYMDIKDAINSHVENKADVTICAKPYEKNNCPREKDGRLSFGIIDADLDNIVKGFKEKPRLEEIDKDEIFVSMGNYIFNKKILKDALADNPEDFGKHVLPRLVAEGKKVMIYDFSKNTIPGMNDKEKKRWKDIRGYWEDVGNIDSYHNVSMDLRDVDPPLNLYNNEWALWRSKHYKNSPPTKPVFSDGLEDEKWFDMLESSNRRISGLYSSLVASGIIISGITLRSVIGANVRIHSYARVIDSVVFDDVDIQRHARIKNAIIDKSVFIPKHTSIGYDREEDLKRGFTVSPGGITVVPKGYVFK